MLAEAVVVFGSSKSLGLLYDQLKHDFSYIVKLLLSKK